MGAKQKKKKKRAELLDLPIGELKNRLVNGREFSEIMKFFFDRFVDEPCFMKAGLPTATVQDVIADAVGQVFASIRQDSALLSTWQITNVPLLNLIHGTVTSSHGVAVLLWATDIEVGLLSLPDMKTGKMLFARLTVGPAKSARTN